MKKIKISVLCALLAAALTVTMWAGEAELLAMDGSGKCGDNITWNLDAAGNLTITGTGDFYGEDSEDYLSWRQFTRYIVSVTISDGIATVPDKAFQNCDYLESVTLGRDVQSIGQEAFEQCSRLADIASAGSLETIGEASFARCSALTDFNFSGLQTIGVAAFYDSGLVNVAISDSVQEIGESAFKSCVKLESVSIGQGVTYLDRQVFSGCQSLKTVTIPATVTAIDKNAFSGEIDDVYYAGTAAQWDKIRGGGADSLAYQAWRIHFESTGPDDAAPMTVTISNANFYRNQVSYNVRFNGNGIQNVNVVTAYYDENGKFIGMFENWTHLPRESGRQEIGQGVVDTENAKTAKIFVLDDDFRPLCPFLRGIVEQ